MLQSIKNIERGSKVCLLISGGFDSTACAYYLKSEGYDVFGITFNYSTRPEKEAAACKNVMQKMDITLHEFELPVEDFRNSSDIAQELDFYNKAWLPYRNIVFFSMAAHISFLNNIRYVSAGIRFWDTPYFDDSTNEYFDKMGELLKFNGYAERSACSVELVLPFINSHVEITEMFRNDSNCRLLLESSWSCWVDGDDPCGECSPCKARHRFTQAVNTGEGIHEFNK